MPQAIDAYHDDSFKSVPADILKVLKGLQVFKEAEMLANAAAWCDENEPSSMRDISFDDDVIEDFVKSLGLETIPEKNIRRVLRRYQTLRPGQHLAPPSEMPPELVASGTVAAMQFASKMKKNAAEASSGAR